jgi:hypothetical protein
MEMCVPFFKPKKKSLLKRWSCMYPEEVNFSINTSDRIARLIWVFKLKRYFQSVVVIPTEIN